MVPTAQLPTGGRKTCPPARSYRPKELQSCYQSKEAFQRALYVFMYSPPFAAALGGAARDAIAHSKDVASASITHVHSARSLAR